MYVKKTVLKKYDDVVQIMNSRSGFSRGEGKGFFTEAELEYCTRRLRCLGARFMIKECVFDYLESSMGQIERNYREIEIVNNKLKKPMVTLFDGIKECVIALNIKDILISISHSRNWISGMVLFCYEKNKGICFL
jgi:phosphopantetheinyl transferase (holo-ACP synthase)